MALLDVFEEMYQLFQGKNTSIFDFSVRDRLFNQLFERMPLKQIYYRKYPNS